LPHFLVNYNNLSQQILSLHILHFITAHFAFITAPIGSAGYHCTLKLGIVYILVVKAIFYSFGTLIAAERA
jgi:hypothetical protein